MNFSHQNKLNSILINKLKDYGFSRSFEFFFLILIYQIDLIKI